MRRLIITRGAQGAGKSTFLQQMGLAPYTLSMDQVRTLLAGPVLNRGGEFEVSQEFNERVVHMTRRLLDERMGRGELLAFDSTAASNGDLDGIMELARQHRYQVAVVDFSTMPLDQVKAQNDARPAHLRVPHAVIERTASKLAVQTRLPRTTHLSWSADGQHREGLQAFLDVPVRDLSGYEQIVHVGDIQGCFAPLAGPGGLLEHGLRDDTFYVFVGDLVDRGPHNAEVVRWVLKHVTGKTNAVILWGNHEDHLHRFAREWTPVSPEFAQRTLPQLEAAGITPAHVERVCAELVEVLPYTFGGQKVLVTHAGLPTVPARLVEVSGHQLARGTGQWSDPIDAQFERIAPKDWVQVHGHRNHNWQGIQATPRSFNLEDGVERGGALRAVTLDAKGWHPQSIPHTQSLAFRDRLPSHAERDDVPQWMRKPQETRLPADVLAALRAHPGVKEKTSTLAPHIASANHTRQVFYDAAWDDLVVKARGLFYVAATGEVAARSYEKFFNIDERPETRMDALMTNLAWPVTSYVKENGYLGLVGIDPTNQKLFLASKSTPDGDFAAWFREIFEAEIAEGTREGMRRWLADHDASAVFEVIDPVRDPHMIDYDKPHLVLLDVFHRSANADKLDYDNLRKFAGRFGLNVKDRGMQFRDAKSFAGWYAAAIKDLTYRHRGRDIEGYVIEDAKGFQTKVKLPHYAFWKRMRSGKDRLVRLREKFDSAHARGERGIQELRQVERDIERTLVRDPHPLAQLFMTWAEKQSSTVLGQSILALRQSFLTDTDPQLVLTAMQERWMAFDPSEGEGQPAPAAPVAAKGPKVR